MRAAEGLFSVIRDALDAAHVPGGATESRAGRSHLPGCRACEALEVLDRAENTLSAWSKCYPPSVFVPPTEEQVRAATDLLKANGFSPDGLYAEWGRHIVRCITDAVRVPEGEKQ